MLGHLTDKDVVSQSEINGSGHVMSQKEVMDDLGQTGHPSKARKLDEQHADAFQSLLAYFI